MPLPSLEDLSSLDLLRLADNPEGVAQLVVANRIAEGKPKDEWQAEEFILLAHIGMTGEILMQVLRELAPTEIISWWAKKTGKLRGKGNPHENQFIYELAKSFHNQSGKPLMKVYREMILPYLIETGQVQTDDKGEPDPYQDKDAQKKFLKAMSRRRK